MSILRKLKNFPPVHPLSETKHEEIISEAKEKVGIASHLDRSFAQYYCLTKTYKSKFLRCLTEVVILPVYLLLIMYLFILGCFNSIFHKTNSSGVKKSLEKVFVIPNASIIPSKVDVGNNSLIINKKELTSLYLLKDFVLSFIILNKRMLYPYYSLKCMYKIYTYSGVVKTGCKEVYVSNEYCFTSSVLTLYINKYNAKSINCMHGEKFLNCRDSFCTYDYFYVWDEYYISLFKRMESKSIFVISDCKAITLNISEAVEERDTVVYFLQGNEGKSDLEKIKENLIAIKKKYNAKCIRVKEHPRYKNKLAHSIFPGEYFYHGDVEKIIKSSLVVCGSYTTLLFQVYSSRKEAEYPKIYINPHEFLRRLNYIMINKADGFFC